MTYDVDKANKVLDDAGYKKGADGFRTTPTGQPIAFSIIVPNGWTDWIDAVQIATEGLRKVGINASVATPEYEQWQKQILDGSFEAVMNSRADGPTPFRGYYQSLSTAFAGTHHQRAVALLQPRARQGVRRLSQARPPTRSARSCSTRCS